MLERTIYTIETGKGYISGLPPSTLTFRDPVHQVIPFHKFSFGFQVPALISPLWRWGHSDISLHVFAVLRLWAEDDSYCSQ